MEVRTRVGVRRVAYACAVCLLVAFVPAARGTLIINEFVAENSGGLTNASGNATDWIELYNDATNAVDVGGWYLTDKASAPTKWRIPDGTLIASNGYRIVFADSASSSSTNGELHASFSLDKDGEYLALVRPDGATVEDAFAPAYPAQYEDVSYGRSPVERECIGAGTSARFRIPAPTGTSTWANAAGALGFAATNASFTVRYYEMTGSVSTLSVAQLMTANGAYWKTDRTYPLVAQYATLDFRGNDASVGSFTNGVTAFPNHASTSVDKNNFVLIAETAISVPQAGQWTFAVGSDDGFLLSISGHGVSFSSNYSTGRSFGNTLATFTFPEAGTYSLTLLFFENTGGAALELSAAQGYQSTLTTDSFRLIGDPAGGIQHAGVLGTFVETDVRAAMLGVNSRLDAEWSFVTNEAPSTNDVVTLHIRSVDGFSAALNGVPLASLNMPASLAWNSAATANRSIADAQSWQAFPVPASALALGTNTLTVTALNDSATNVDFLIQPRLLWRTAARTPGFFKVPTPGRANGQSYTAPTPKVTASEPRGFKRGPFTVSLSCEDSANAVIRYTLDGNAPWTNSAIYVSPLAITNTTVLRAAVVDPATLKLNVRTVTWLFLDDILAQGTNPPSGWPASGSVNAQSMEYGLLSSIATGDPVRLRAGMTNAIPTLSLVTDLTNLFSAASGIYVNPGNDGDAWERPVSVELIDPVRGTNFEFRIDAGLRIRGAASRSTTNPKHSFRLFFRSDYGEPTLKFKLFDGEGADEFQKIDLRTSQNYSWAWAKSTQDTFVRETFSRDTQRDMGQPYTRSRYYHLYLNGQYWGLYQTQERGSADFAATYIDGSNDDWDCIKTSRDGSSGYQNTATDGSFDAFYALHSITVNEGYSGAYSNNYWRVRGMNPDGSSNTNYPVYLDQDNLIDYMLVAYYTGDPDSPISIWGGFPNNMYALFNRKTPSGFKWLRHDAEHSLGANGSYGVTCDTTYAGTNLTAQSLFNPGTLHQRLCLHPDYRMRFADLTYRHLYNTGVLTPTNAQLRFRSRMSEIDTAIIGESARWGHGYTRDGTWLPTCNTVLGPYLSQRRDLIVTHFRNHGWYPWLETPAYSTNNATVLYGATLRVSATNNFYYTTDGSDPRLPGGGINPAATLIFRAGVTSAVATARVLVSTNAVWAYYDAGKEPPATNGLSWKEPNYPSSSWGSGPGVLGFAGSAPTSPIGTATHRYTNGVSGTQVTTTYFRRTFTLASSEVVTSLAASLLRDDGVVVYINGTEVLRDNMPSGAMSYTNFASANASSVEQTNRLARTIGAVGALRAGENVVAVEVHQANASSTDLYFDLSLTAQFDAYSALAGSTSIPVTNDLTVLARSYDGADWSPLSQATLALSHAPVDYSPLRVSELLYAPPTPSASSGYSNDDFSWLEIRNTGSTALNLSGVRFAAGITHTFTSSVLSAGARLVLAKNPAAFATRYDTNGVNLVAWSSGNLARKGETLSLVDPNGTNILTFTYSNTWYPSSYNTGHSLVAVDLAAAEPLWSTAANWRPSGSAYGSPGKPDSPVITKAAFAKGAGSGAASALALSTDGIDGTPEVWYSDDLRTWHPCPSAAWTRLKETLTIDLGSASLPGASARFFQLRISD